MAHFIRSALPLACALFVGCCCVIPVSANNDPPPAVMPGQAPSAPPVVQIAMQR